MALSLNKRYRHIRRYRRIGEVLIRHGFGYMLQQLDLGHFLPPLKRLKPYSKRDPHVSVGTRLRSALEDLGPTFIKFGQLLSTRGDVLPMDIVAELEQLQDAVRPVGFSEIERQIEEQFGQPVEAVFGSVDPEPLAAASIGQVHHGVMLDGTRVVIKVQRPNIRGLINTDLEILYGLARSLQDKLRPYSIDAVGLVHEFSQSIRKELDYTKEGRNIDRFRRSFEHINDVRVPHVYWQLTTERVLTMEFVDGYKINDIERLRSLGFDMSRLAEIVADSFMKQVFEDGFFHGDPHMGNIMVCPDGRLAYLDFGIMGRLDPSTMEGLARLLVSIVRQDIDGLIEVLFDLEAFTGSPSRQLRLDVQEVIDYHYGKSLKELDFGQIIEDLMDLVQRHPLQMPNEMLVLAKALVTLESVGRRRSPEFNVMEYAEPFAQNWMKKQYGAAHLTRRGGKQLRDLSKSLSRLPGEFESALHRMNAGDMEIRFRHEGLERLINRLDVASNRLTFGIIIGSLIMGSSVLLMIDQGPHVMQIPAIGLAGYLLAGVLGFWLLISILRSGRY